MLEHINKLFLAMIVLSTLTYFQRPDYNLPLFAFTLVLWSLQSSKLNEKLQKELKFGDEGAIADVVAELLKDTLFSGSQKLRLWYLITFSLLTDAIWIIYWGVVWNSYDNS